MQHVLGSCLVLLSLAMSASADLLEVGPGGHPTIQAALNAATDGDTIVVAAPGSYPGFTVQAKGVTVVAEGGIAHIGGPIVVRGTSIEQHVLVQGFSSLGWPSPHDGSPYTFQPPASVGLLVEFCDGLVRFADCTFEGASSTAHVVDMSPQEHSAFPAGGRGAWLRANADVSFVRCTFQGGRSPFMLGIDSCQCTWGFPGGTGLHIQQGVTVLYDCDVIGGPGGGGEGGADHGGYGCHVVSGTLFTQGSTFHGADGGGTEACGADGGHGLRAEPGAVVFLRDNASAGGAGSLPWGGYEWCPGKDGLPYSLEGAVTTLSTPATSVVLSSPVRDDAIVDLAAAAEPGSALFAALSLHDGSAWSATFSGWWSIGLPFELVPVGIVPAGGLAAQVAAPSLPPGVDVLSLRLQGLATPDLVQASLTNWTPLVILPAGL